MEVITKVCACGQIHECVPPDFKLNERGIWFQCENPDCESTLLISVNWDEANNLMEVAE